MQKFQSKFLTKPLNNYIQSDTENELTITLPFTSKFIKEYIRLEINEFLTERNSNKIVNIHENSNDSHALNTIDNLSKVTNIIFVSSAKGGVGKSTTAANIALALQHEGKTVGLLDADIYGPSICALFKITEKLQGTNNGFIPVVANGLKIVSMGMLSDNKTPMILRGPMASSALTQMLTQTKWGELDYLIVDLPPGTGDIQLTLGQKIISSGAVIVTTPDEIALLDTTRGIEMMQKLNIPIIGIIENMSLFICRNCGHKEHIFGTYDLNKFVAQYNTCVLGSLPLSIKIRDNKIIDFHDQSMQDIIMLYAEIISKILEYKNVDALPILQIN